jgi:D-alanine-D-alanine ligase
MEKIKVGIFYNEPNPEIYLKKPELPKTELLFETYFDVEDVNPIESYKIIAELLKNNGFDAYTYNIKDSITGLFDNIKRRKPDVIFNFIEIFNNDPKHELNIAGLFELLKIPYTGAPPLALANCQSKVLTKRILSVNGIKTPKFELYDKVQNKYPTKLKFPIIVKPVYEDASAGIENASVVKNKEELNKRITFIINDFNQPALIEEYIEGRELNVSVMGDDDPVVLPISEIDFSKMPKHLENIVSFQAKWDPMHESYHKTIPICPSILPEKVEKKAKAIALKAFKVMEVRDYARVDMRLSKDNKLYVLEVNPNPDLTEGAGFMRSSDAAGLTYDKTLAKIVELAYKRKAKQR